MKIKPNWLDQKVLREQIDSIADLQKKEINIDKNIVDPFAAVFETTIENYNQNTYVKQEKIRQLQKTLSNKIGDLHQEILGSIPDWISTGKNGGGIDLICKKRKIIAEIKNKYNTVKGSNLYKEIYCNLDSFLKKESFKGYTAYYVTIIGKKGETGAQFFTPSMGKEKGKAPIRDDILLIDGRSFYAMATGDKNAIDQLFELVIDEVVSKKKLDPSMLELLKKFFCKAFPKS
jgi:hypothetical protein